MTLRWKFATEALAARTTRTSASLRLQTGHDADRLETAVKDGVGLLGRTPSSPAYGPAGLPGDHGAVAASRPGCQDPKPGSWHLDQIAAEGRS